MEWLSDPLFRTPFLTGLALAATLPLLGMYLRLRGEWLAALAFPQVASAGALLATVVQAPLVAGGACLAVAAALLKGRFGRQGDAGYALMLLGGWAVSGLLAANLPLAQRTAEALFDGQLFLVGAGELAMVLAAGGLLLGGLRRLSRPLLLLRFFPQFFRASGLPECRHALAFDVLGSLVLACATTAIGVIATFGLAFIPPWIAFRRSGNWRSGLVWAVAIGVGAYCAAFAGALILDQPFGPVCAVTIFLVAVFDRGYPRRAGA